ncbi:MAG: hypothetical protein H8Z69_04060 [Nanohaloarchaea archaeon]|nr:hypothetical protein [Candidatus Nanohaloarchaea archaeon]
MGEGNYTSIEDYSQEGEFEVVTAFNLVNEFDMNPEPGKMWAVADYLMKSLQGKDEADSYDEAILKSARNTSIDRGDNQLDLAYDTIEELGKLYLD